MDLLEVHDTSASFEVQVIGYFSNYVLCDEIEISPSDADISLFPTESPEKPGAVYASGLQPETCYTLTTKCCNLYSNDPSTQTGRDCFGGSEDFCTLGKKFLNVLMNLKLQKVLFERIIDQIIHCTHRRHLRTPKVKSKFCNYIVHIYSKIFTRVFAKCLEAATLAAHFPKQLADSKNASKQ